MILLDAKAIAHRSQYQSVSVTACGRIIAKVSTASRTDGFCKYCFPRVDK